MTSGCNLFSVGVVTILLAFHIWNKTILLLREIENLEAEQDIFCPSSGLRLRHPLLAHTWLSERSANAKPCVLSALALPRPGSARHGAPSVTVRREEAQPGRSLSGSLARALAQAAFALLPEATEASDPAQPTLLCPALSTGPGQLCSRAQPSPAQPRHSWPNSRANLGLAAGRSHRIESD